MSGDWRKGNFRGVTPESIVTASIVLLALSVIGVSCLFTGASGLGGLANYGLATVHLAVVPPAEAPEAGSKKTTQDTAASSHVARQDDGSNGCDTTAKWWWSRYTHVRQKIRATPYRWLPFGWKRPRCVQLRVNGRWVSATRIGRPSWLGWCTVKWSQWIPVKRWYRERAYYSHYGWRYRWTYVGKPWWGNWVWVRKWHINLRR